MAQGKREIAADSLQKFQLQVLELDSNNEVAGELGPLQYLSGLTGTPMDKIINVLLLIIIFVFDPLAISLVVAANFAFDKAYPKKKYRENLYGEDVEVKPLTFEEQKEQYIKDHGKHWDDKENTKGATLEEQAKYTNWEEEYTEDDEKRMNIIGQNGNDGEHYSEIDDKITTEMEEDGVYLTKKDGREIDKKTYFEKLMNKVSLSKKDDDNTKTY